MKAQDGEEAFSLFQQYKPDILITDWHMDHDGLELTRWIRRNKQSINRMIPIVLMTGFTDLTRITGARDNGVTEIIVKPFNAEDLAKRLMHVIDLPRDFIESMGFFGPDRRRKNADYTGKDRRNMDPEEVVTVMREEDDQLYIYKLYGINKRKNKGNKNIARENWASH